MNSSAIQLGALACASTLLVGRVVATSNALAGDGTPTFTANGQAGDDLGLSVSTAGDFNNDGFDDIVVGAPELHQSFPRGYARVYSGLDGSLLATFNGPNLFGSYGLSVAGGGDLNNDGHDDVVIGAPDDRVATGQPRAGIVYAYSGADNSLLFAIPGNVEGDNFGWSVGIVGDVNNDGKDDVVVGAPGVDQNGPWSGAVMVLSGAGGSTLFTKYGPSADANHGWSVAGAGDVDGDTVPDVVAGGTNGIVRVYSGQDGSILTNLVGGTAFGFSVASAGDCNNDGRCEVIVGDPSSAMGASAGGFARVFSSDGSAMMTFVGYSAGGLLGRNVSSARIDADSIPDMIVGGNGFAKVYSGADGSLLATLNEPAPLNGFAVSIRNAGDVDTDGWDEVVVGIPSQNIGGDEAGAVMIIDLDLSGSGGGGPGGGPTAYCSTSPNSYGWIASIGHEGSTSLAANDLRLTVAGTMPTSNGIFFGGSERASTPFGDGTMCVGGSVFRINPAQTASGTGSADLDLDYLRDPFNGQISPGSTLRFQYWYRDNFSPSGYNTSNGLEVTFTP